MFRALPHHSTKRAQGGVRLPNAPGWLASCTRWSLKTMRVLVLPVPEYYLHITKPCLKFQRAQW